MSILTQCIERERKAETGVRMMTVRWETLEAARAATDEAVRAVEAELKGLRADAGRWRFWSRMMPFARRIRGGVKVCFPNWPAPMMRGYHETEGATLDEAIDIAQIGAAPYAQATTPAPTAQGEPEEVGCAVDWQHVAKQCREALDGPDGMVTLHRGALSLALVAVEQFITAQGESTGGVGDE